jgi:hypothetical protein
MKTSGLSLFITYRPDSHFLFHPSQNFNIFFSGFILGVSTSAHFLLSYHSAHFLTPFSGLVTVYSIQFILSHLSTGWPILLALPCSTRPTAYPACPTACSTHATAYPLHPAAYHTYPSVNPARPTACSTRPTAYPARPTACSTYATAYPLHPAAYNTCPSANLARPLSCSTCPTAYPTRSTVIATNYAVSHPQKTMFQALLLTQ